MKILGTTYAIDTKTLKAKIKEETGIKAMCSKYGSWGQVSVHLKYEDRTAENRAKVDAFFKRHDVVRAAPDGIGSPFCVNSGEWNGLKYINYYQTTISTKLP